MQIPPEIISVDEALLLRFKSDDTINSKGFSAAYVIIDEHDNFEDYSDVINRQSGSRRPIYPTLSVSEGPDDDNKPTPPFKLKAVANPGSLRELALEDD